MAIVKVEKNSYTVDSVYQWDKNQDLVIYGLSLATIPEIHFANDAMDKTIVRQSTMDDAGVIRAEIPNSLLQKPYKIRAYVCIYEGDTFKSLYLITIPIQARSMPLDYTLTVSDDEVYSFNALENKLENTLALSLARYDEVNQKYEETNETYNHVVEIFNESIQAHNQSKETFIAGIETVNQAKESAQTSAENASASATSASKSASTATTKASEAKTSATNASTSEKNASASAEIAVNAQSKAETAQVYVENAKNKVYEYLEVTEDAMEEAVKAKEAIDTAILTYGQLTPLFANSINECTDKSKLYVLPSGYIYAYMKTKADYTNVIPLSVDEDGNIYNGQGWKSGYRLNSSGVETEQSGMCLTGFIPASNSVVRLKNVTPEGTKDAYIATYTEDKTFKNVLAFSNICTQNDQGIYEGTLPQTETTAFIRFSLGTIDETSIITVDEEIVGSGVDGEQWLNTGHMFVPADYEDRIIYLEGSETDHEKRLMALETLDVSVVPSYVAEESEIVGDNLLSSRNYRSFVMASASDLHTTGSDDSAPGVLHAGMAMNAINGITQLDLVALLGDIMVGYFDDSYKAGFKFVKKCFLDVAKAVPFIQLQGNHDQISTDSTDEAKQKYYAYIGANNVGAVTDYDNKYRNYGYMDFNNHKMRVIYLNSADVSAYEITDDCYLTADQLSWFVNVALDFSDKSDASEWDFIVLSHHPLNWFGNISNVLTLLDAYKGKTRGSISIDNETISYDFTNVLPRFIAHFHGHIHNFRVETLGTNGIVSITVPNACFSRNNEYGTYDGYSDEVHTKYGDTDAEGNQRQFNKTANSAEDTAFNIVDINRVDEKIYLWNYGAGIDRVVSFDGTVT